MRLLWWRANDNGTKLPGTWRLYREAVIDYRDNWQLMAALISIVALPLAVIGNLVSSAGSYITTPAPLTFAQISLNVAVVYAVMALVRGKSITIREAYYRSSVVLVRLLLTAFWWTLMLLPVIAGIFIARAGLTTVGTVVPVGEELLILLLAVLVAIPGVVMIVRGGWALFVLFETQAGPIQAIRTSRRYTKNRVVALLGRLIGLALLLLVTLLVPVVMLEWLRLLSGWIIFSMLLEYVTTLIVIPLAGFYLYRLYRELRS